MKCEQYVAKVLAMPREVVTDVYAQLYREADDITWPYEGEELKAGVVEGEPILLSDEDVERFATQDYYDGPEAWAFTLEEEG